jgi:endonuclease III-like uncharacterized protein
VETRDKARRLIQYLEKLDDFEVVDAADGGYAHIGATIADAILQAGTNYGSVVSPRVRRIRETYPEAVTTSAFQRLIEKEGVKQTLLWKDDEKPNRLVALTKFLLAEGIETEAGLATWLKDEANTPSLLGLRGVGPKTADYLKILVGMETAAADRHVFKFLEEAGVATKDYHEAREILHLAADARGVGRTLFDHSIWRYMSKRERRLSQPLNQEF